MELRQLRYFLAVARTLNFTRAAQEVHIAQPPLSRQIANLEEELGVQLLVRDPRALQLTDAGRFFERRAEEILGRIDRLKADISALGGGAKEKFRIGVIPSLLYGRTKVGIAYLRRTHPHLEIELAVYLPHELLEEVRKGNVDLAVGREFSGLPELVEVVVREEPLMLALPEGHPVCRRGDTGIWLREVEDEVFIVHSRPSGAWSDDVTRLCERAKFVPATSTVTRDLPAALGMVAAGAGVSVVPAAARRMRRDDVCYVSLLDPGAVSSIIMATTRGPATSILHEIQHELARTALPTN